MKTCSKCKQDLPFDAFRKDPRYRNDRASYCRTCAKAYRRAREYGLSGDRFREMLEGQGYRCAVCEESITESAHVDHDHATGRVRGLLCPPCNQGVGFLGDSPERLRSAAAYLEVERETPWEDLTPGHQLKDECPHGHKYTPENTRRRSNNARVCRECQRIGSLKYYYARKQRLA